MLLEFPSIRKSWLASRVCDEKNVLCTFFGRIQSDLMEVVAVCCSHGQVRLRQEQDQDAMAHRAVFSVQPLLLDAAFQVT
jgi:hypothetical protein